MAMEKNFDAASKEAKIWKKWEDANAFKAGVNALPNACLLYTSPSPRD